MIYTYDDLGQLTKEVSGNTTRDYTYDDAGNITAIKNTTISSGGQIIKALNPTLPGLITTTTTLSYTNSEWGDLLTKYNGTTITYDEIGNPLSYYNGSAYSFSWEGRRLVGATKGSKTMSFTYDDEGIRTSKTVNGVTHTYYLNGSLIVAEQWSDKLLVYLYDVSGTPIGMMYRTTSYAVNQWDVFWFEKNLQGDVVAVYNSAGTKVAAYTYTDAWGNHSVSYTNGGGTTGAQYNPFRYRGYYYDTDLEMYYLQSRYYDAKICRFINADGYVSTGQGLTGNNMFAYCNNNPVNYVDYSGKLAIVDDLPTLCAIFACFFVVLCLVKDVTGDQVLGNLISDFVTQTADAVDNFVSSIKTFSDSKADEKEGVNQNPPSGTVIYRYYSSKTGNLAPRVGKDYDGLSFSTIPPINGKPYTVTTIEQINSTGILIAERQGTHVSVRPTNGTVLEWMYQGMNSIWSKTLSSIVVEWE